MPGSFLRSKTARQMDRSRSSNPRRGMASGEQSLKCLDQVQPAVAHIGAYRHRFEDRSGLLVETALLSKQPWKSKYGQALRQASQKTLCRRYTVPPSIPSGTCTVASK